MRKKSQTAAVLLPSIVFVAGLLVMSPSAGFMLMVLTAVLATVPFFFGRGAVRIIGMTLLLLSIALSASYYPHFKSEQQGYMRKYRQAHEQPR